MVGQHSLKFVYKYENMCLIVGGEEECHCGVVDGGILHSRACPQGGCAHDIGKLSKLPKNKIENYLNFLKIVSKLSKNRFENYLFFS
jgi:hypothetical protein